MIKIAFICGLILVAWGQLDEIPWEIDDNYIPDEFIPEPSQRKPHSTISRPKPGTTVKPLSKKGKMISTEKPAMDTTLFTVGNISFSKRLSTN